MGAAHQAGLLIKTSGMKATFSAWARRTKSWSVHSVFGFVRPWLLRWRLSQVSLARGLQKKIAVSLRQRYAELTEAVASDFRSVCNGSFTESEHADQNEITMKTGTRSKYIEIKALMPKQSSQHAFIHDSNEKPTSNQKEEDETFADHFKVAYGSSRTISVCSGCGTERVGCASESVAASAQRPRVVHVGSRAAADVCVHESRQSYL